ncbi:MAG: DUF1156 domain-containing protein [Pseudomonadota bacterium]
MSTNIKAPKKLIEVALPLDDINAAAAREKSIRHGHPSTLHLWWARRPLAAARAVLFAQMVNDPGGARGYYAGKTKAQADAEREKLFDIIRDLVKWENTSNEEVLERARAAIRQSWRETCELNKGKPGFDPDKLPAFHDPFAGGGAIPLEAQRLGLEAYASDLNPVAVLITKAMIEIPPKFAGRTPVGPVLEGEKQGRLRTDWPGATSLAEDVRRYGHWMRQEAGKRIGNLYPKVKVTAEMAERRPDLKPYAGKELTVIAWLWARTVKSPNPAFSHVDVPLVSSFVLSTKKGKEAWVHPVVEGDDYRFEVGVGKRDDLDELKRGNKLGGANFRCILSDSPIEPKYIRVEGQAGHLGAHLMAIVAEGTRERVYLSPTKEMEDIAQKAEPTWKPDVEFFEKALGFRVRNYGFRTWAELFTQRQLVALTTFSDLVTEVRTRIIEDAKATGMADDGVVGLDAGSTGATAYGDAVVVYLALAVDKLADRNSTIASWATSREHARNTFGRQAVPMTWDFAESNPFSESSGNFFGGIKSISDGLCNVEAYFIGTSAQANAGSQTITAAKVVSTDPPYYDNIGYADLSDFFYVWLRRSLKPIYPRLFATLTTPKTEELIATPGRHGSKEAAESFFMGGMTRAIHNLAEQAHPAFPVTIYYAFKQSETKEEGTGSTGWGVFLEAVLRSGFAITGTWPSRTELSRRLRGQKSNALASSIVLVCRKREASAESISRRQFQHQLREEMPEALETMIGGTSGQSPIAPVDLAQAAIGPGMAIFSKYSAVLNQDGSKMSVHDALILINRAKDEILGGIVEADTDTDTGFCVDWFAQYGWSNGPFGEADTLSRAKGTTVDGVREAGIIESGGGKVRLLKWPEYSPDWNPEKDNRTPVWEACHHLIRELDHGGESEAGALLARMPERGESIRALTYHLYTLCERKKWAEEARAYNELMTAWHAILATSYEVGHVGSQTELEL